MNAFSFRTADHMRDYLGSDGDPGWVFFRQFGHRNAPPTQGSGSLATAGPMEGSPRFIRLPLRELVPPRVAVGREL